MSSSNASSKKLKITPEAEFQQIITNILENINTKYVKCLEVCEKLNYFYGEKFNYNLKNIANHIQILNKSPSLHIYYKKLNSMFSFFIGFIVAKQIKDNEKKNHFLKQVVKNWEESLVIVDLI